MNQDSVLGSYICIYSSSNQSVQYTQLHYFNTTHPFDGLNIDVMIKCTPTICGHQRKLTLIYQLAGFVIAVPTTNKMVNTAFIHAVVCIFGTSEAALSDDGINFHNSLFKILLQFLHIHTFCSLFYAQGTLKQKIYMIS